MKIYIISLIAFIFLINLMSTTAAGVRRSKNCKNKLKLNN
jgi:hypothetical protein